MTLPPDNVMLTLLALWTGEGIEVRGADLVVTLPGQNAQPIPPAVLDQLEDRGWVTIADDGRVVPDPEKTRYALDRWMTKRFQARGGHGNIQLRAARISPIRPITGDTCPARPVRTRWSASSPCPGTPR